MSDLISVVIPVYNGAKYLAQCLDSVLNQTYQEFEIIVINDGSTDSSTSIVEEYIQNDNRIQLVSQENQGVQLAREKGVSLAKGVYIYFLDADDYIETDALELLLGPFKTIENIGITYGCRQKISGDGSLITTKKTINMNTSSDQFGVLISPFVPEIGASLIRKKLLQDLPEIPAIKIGEDWIMWLYLAKKGGVFFYIGDKIIYNYRMHSTNTTKQHYLDPKKYFIAHNYVFNNDYLMQGITIKQQQKIKKSHYNSCCGYYVYQCLCNNDYNAAKPYLKKLFWSGEMRFWQYNIIYLFVFIGWVPKILDTEIKKKCLI